MLQVSQYPSRLTGVPFLAYCRGKLHHTVNTLSVFRQRGVNGYRDPYGIRTVVGKQYRYIRNLFPEMNSAFRCRVRFSKPLANWMS